jgi:hypothetical protein
MPMIDLATLVSASGHAVSPRKPECSAWTCVGAYRQQRAISASQEVNSSMNSSGVQPGTVAPDCWPRLPKAHTHRPARLPNRTRQSSNPLHVNQYNSKQIENGIVVAKGSRQRDCSQKRLRSASSDLDCERAITKWLRGEDLKIKSLRIQCLCGELSEI